MSRGAFTLLILLLALARAGSGEVPTEFSRGDFPPEFVFGAGTSAYQVEGAVAEDGRTPSIWDTFTHAGKAVGGSNGDISCDGYHRYKEDIKHMSDTGLEAYRFSISWSRLIPNGRGAVNPKGLEFYNKFINELIKFGIQPHVTLYHFDLPQILEDEYAGWLSPKIVDDFTAFADVCFREFGDRVIHWTTINEPNVISLAGYDSGSFPPRRCSHPFGSFNCTAGNSTVEPYIVLHNALLAHAAAVKLYRTKYKAHQHGSIGINLCSMWTKPLTNSTADKKAAERAMDFMVGSVVNPVVFGDFPESMKNRAGSRIPSFTKSQSELVKGSVDFIGINYYISLFVGNRRNPLETDLRDFSADIGAVFTAEKNGTTFGRIPPIVPLNPYELPNLLEYLQRVYGNPPIYIHENGYATSPSITVNDTDRVDALRASIGAMLSAIRNGSNTKGYFVWSFLDVFEFMSGYETQYGLYHIDFKDKDLKRRPKLSALWYRGFIKRKHIPKAGKDGNLRSPVLDLQESNIY